MPFVQRNHRKKIVGVFAGLQPGYAEEELPEDDPEVVAFRLKHPIPAAMLKPLTEKDLARIRTEARRVEKEHAMLKEAIWAFSAQFNELEIALSALVAAALSLKGQMAYAIYYTPDGFRARQALVNNVVTQLIRENKKLKDLSDLWKSLQGTIGEVRNTRNLISHGHPQTFIIGSGRPRVRLASPAFDVLEVGRKIEDGDTFGLGASEILLATRKAAWLRDRLDEVNRLVADALVRAPLRKRFAELRAGLQTPRH